MSTKSRRLSIGRARRALVRVLADKSSAMQAIASYVAKASGARSVSCPSDGRVAVFLRLGRRLARYGSAIGSSNDRRNRKFLVVAYAALLTAGIYAAEAEDRQVAKAAERIAFSIPRQPLAGALQAYGQATGIQVLYESNSAVGRRRNVHRRCRTQPAPGRNRSEGSLHPPRRDYTRPSMCRGCQLYAAGNPAGIVKPVLGNVAVRGTNDDAAGLQDFQPKAADGYSERPSKKSSLLSGFLRRTTNR